MELPCDFPHQPPKGYQYRVEQYKRNTVSIWLLHPDHYNYSDDRVSTIWGFYDSKTRQYFAPINSKKPGKVVNISNTRPYTAMQLNLTPLEAAFS